MVLLRMQRADHAGDLASRYFTEYASVLSD